MDILPKADKAIIPIEKLTKYALDPLNGMGKHVAFRDALGYTTDNAELLKENILSNLSHYSARSKGNDGYGEKYAVLMDLTGANGKTANVLTAWLDDNKTGEMRLTSVYIKKRKVKSND